MRPANEGAVEIVRRVEAPGELQADSGIPILVVQRPERSTAEWDVGMVEDEAVAVGAGQGSSTVGALLASSA
jgi:hypothetical protein